MHHVLVIAFKFPDLLVTGGSTRVEKFVKYLPRHGWRPRVLSVHLPEGADREAVHCGPRVHRTRSHYPAFVRAYRTRYVKGRGGEASKAIEALRRLKNHILVPDDTILWWPHALPAALSLIRRYRPKVIFASGPPFSGLLLGGLLGGLTGIPFVADLRDDWAGNPMADPRNLVQSLTEGPLERLTVRLADRVVHVTPGSLDLYSDRYPRAAKRMRYIPNGYDEEDFADLGPLRKRGGELTLLHTGTLTSGRTPRPIFEAMKHLAEQDSRFGALRFVQVGMAHREHLETARSLGVERRVEWCGAKPRPEMLAAMDSSHALALIPTPGVETAVPGKAYEYFRARRPVLVLTKPNEVSRLVSEFAGSVVRDPDDIEGIARTLAGWFDADDPAVPDPEDVRRFDRDRLAAALADLLEETVRERRGE